MFSLENFREYGKELYCAPVSWKSDETYAESAGSDCKEILLITFNTYFKLNSPFRGVVLRKSMSLIFLLGTSNLT